VTLRMQKNFFFIFFSYNLLSTAEINHGCITGETSSTQCWGSVTFWRGSGSADPYFLGLTDPDPTPFFSDFKDAKKKEISYFFLINYYLLQR
jgi:hypothetical protein